MRPLGRIPGASSLAVLILSFFVPQIYPYPGDTSGLRIETTQPVQCDRKTHVGDRIQVNYKGTLQSDGSEFDSSYGRGETFTFVLGNEGILDMCIGEGRILTIPPEFGYGTRGMGPIPPDSTLGMCSISSRKDGD